MMNNQKLLRINVLNFSMSDNNTYAAFKILLHI